MYVATKTMEAWAAWFGFATREWIVVGKGAEEDGTGAQLQRRTTHERVGILAWDFDSKER
jgi:hypothetical protein